MMNVLKFVIGSFAIISRAETPASESGIYRQYLLKFGKSFARMSEPARVATFFESVHYIYDYEMSKRNSAHGSSSTQYSLGFNEMTDWLPHEVESRFSMNQGNSSLSTSGAAVSKTNYVMESPGDGESTTEPVSDAEKVRRSVLSLEENFEREKVILNLLHFVAAAPAIDEDGEAKTGGLNWASDLNPRGSPVLSIVRNQGLCGACWAFVATSSVEAQVRIAGGKQIPLSVQELVDCDTALNRGCNGGNPLYAFEYTMTNALTSWDDYPYKETASVCRRSKFRARSSVEGYRKLSVNNQMQLLQYVDITPVAVGICGTDKSFMFYSKGIYNAPNCCNVQNHAVLLVGYGHDAATNLNYWIALNSWGVMWGERGYMRLLRTNETASAGQCGLAMNPVAALGGYVLSRDDLDPDPTVADKEEKKWSNVHQLPFGAAFYVWLGNNWQTVCLIGAGILMSLSLSLLAYAAFADYTHALQEKKRRAQRSSSSNSEDSTHDPRALGGDSASTNGPYYQNVPISETSQDVSRGPGEYVEWDLGNLASAAFSSLSSYPAQPPPTHTHRQEYIEVPIRHPVSSPFNFQQPSGGLNE